MQRPDRSLRRPAQGSSPGGDWTLTSLVTAATVALYTMVWMVGSGGSEAIAEVQAISRWLLLLPALWLAVPAGLTLQTGEKSQIAFLALTGLSVILAQNAVPSLAIWTRMAMAFLIVRGCLHLGGRQKLAVQDVIYWTLAALIALSLAVWALGLGFSYESAQESVRPRVRGIAATSGILGYAAALLAPWAAYKALRRTVGVNIRLAHLAIALGAVVALALSDSRSGTIASVVGLGFVLAIPAVRTLSRSLSGFTAVSTALTLLILAGYAIPIMIGAQLVETRYWANAADSTLIRFALWEAGVSDFLAHPVSGNGLGSLIYVYAKSSLIEREDFYYHSALLNYLAKCGLFAGIAFVAMLHAANRALVWSIHCVEDLRAVRPAAATQNSAERIIASTILLTVTVAFSVTEAPLQNIYPSFLFLFIAVASLPVAYRPASPHQLIRNG